MRRNIFAAVLLALLIVAGNAHALGWAVINATIRSQFPDVPRITTAELAQWLNDPSRPAPLLLDVRTPAEFEVSHLAHAERIDPEASAAAVHAEKNRPIVTYCSVGYRSSKIARALIKVGYKDVRNLGGSIFAWANEGRPVYRDGHLVDKVHPFNSTWGLLLAKRYHAPVASP